MPSKSEIQKQIDALTDQLSTADDDDEFDIEIWDSSGNGARVPYRKGKDWFEKTFGISVGDAGSGNDPKQGGKAGPGQGKPGAQGSQSGDGDGGNGPAVLRHLRQSGGAGK